MARNYQTVSVVHDLSEGKLDFPDRRPAVGDGTPHLKNLLPCFGSSIAKANYAIGVPKGLARSMVQPEKPLLYFDSPRLAEPYALAEPNAGDVRLYSISLRKVEHLLAQRGIEICHERARLRWNRFGPVFPTKFAASGLTQCGRERIGNGISTRNRYRLTAGCATFC